MTGEPKGLGVLLAVPTRGYVWCDTAVALAPYHPQYVREKLSVSNVRNKICRDFLKTEADVLVMCDDDVIPPRGFIDQLAECPYDVVAAPVPIAKAPAHTVFANVFNVTAEGAIMTVDPPESGHIPCDAVGSGCTLIRRRVLEDERMKRPFDQQLDDDGLIVVGQDLEFSRRARALGYTLGADFGIVCDHYVSLHLNAIALAYHNNTKQILEAAAAAAA